MTHLKVIQKLKEINVIKKATYLGNNLCVIYVIDVIDVSFSICTFKRCVNVFIVILLPTCNTFSFTQIFLTLTFHFKFNYVLVP